MRQCLNKTDMDLFLSTLEFTLEQVYRVNDLMMFVASQTGAKLWIWDGVAFCANLGVMA